MNTNHKLYTSHRNTTDEIMELGAVSILICGRCQDIYDGLVYGNLEPTASIQEEEDYDKYKERYLSEVFAELSPMRVVEQLCALADIVSDKTIVLFMELMSGEFDLYNLIMEWFQYYHIECLDYFQMKIRGRL